jgi:23S rRNA (cytosine1962-C5)-methyltransferase
VADDHRQILESNPTDAEATVVTLGDPWAGRVAGGVPHLELVELAGSLPEMLQAGQAVALQSDAAGRLGYGLVDPDNGVIRVLPAKSRESFDPSFVAHRVVAAAELRRRLGFVTRDLAYRLVNAEGDGLSGFVVDVYAQHAVIYAPSAALEPYVDWLAAAVVSELSPPSVIAKIRPATPTPKSRIPFRVCHGASPPDRLVITENDVRYEVHLTGGLNTGLFCEMRDVRRALGPWVAGRRVLNTFSYTGSFSVVAALAGARSVVSVDFAAGALAWSKTNFQLNGLDPNSRRFAFVRADVIEFLKSERRKGRKYDVILLDPPAATAVPTRRWYLESDYDRLIGHALGALAEKGMVMAAASSVRSRPEKLENQIRAAARDHHRRLRLVGSFALPPDFPTQMIHPQSRFLKCFFLVAD